MELWCVFVLKLLFLSLKCGLFVSQKKKKKQVGYEIIIIFYLKKNQNQNQIQIQNFLLFYVLVKFKKFYSKFIPFIFYF